MFGIKSDKLIVLMVILLFTNSVLAERRQQNFQEFKKLINKATFHINEDLISIDSFFLKCLTSNLEKDSCFINMNYKFLKGQKNQIFYVIKNLIKDTLKLKVYVKFNSVDEDIICFRLNSFILFGYLENVQYLKENSNLRYIKINDHPFPNFGNNNILVDYPIKLNNEFNKNDNDSIETIKYKLCSGYLYFDNDSNSIQSNESLNRNVTTPEIENLEQYYRSSKLQIAYPNK